MHTDIQTIHKTREGRQTDGHTYIQTDRQTTRQRDRPYIQTHTYIHTYTHTDRQTDNQPANHRDRQGRPDRQTDIQTE